MKPSHFLLKKFPEAQLTNLHIVELCSIIKEYNEYFLIDIDPVMGKIRNFQWLEMKNSFISNYDSLELIEPIKNALLISPLNLRDNIFVEISSSLPIIKIPTMVFIDNWYDFICASGGMGSILCSDDYLHVIEFTGHGDYKMYSNFYII